MSWNAHIAIRCNGKLNEAHWDEVKKWPEVEKVWSSMGEWDYWIRLKPSLMQPDELEKFVFNLRKQPWVESTCARWWKEI